MNQAGDEERQPQGVQNIDREATDLEEAHEALRRATGRDAYDKAGEDITAVLQQAADAAMAKRNEADEFSSAACRS